MRDIFVSISILILIISFFTFSLTYIKANLDKDGILYKKSWRYIIPLFSSLMTLCIICEYYNEVVCIILLLLNISVYICILLYNTKWNHDELDFEKAVEERILRDCTNFTEEDFTKFMKDMSRAEQIRWLKSLTWIYEETSEELHEDGTKTTITTEEIVPLIECDEDLEDFKCFLKKDK